MLCSLHIENIAIMDNVDIAFEPGFCVLTGETGAGKSILIDSVNLLTGERSSKELVRTGCDKAFVEGAVYTDDKQAFLVLDEAGIGYDEGEPIILSREISKDGRSVVRINGRISTTAILKSLCARLINIHGQHDNQSILNAAYHGAFLDDYADLKDELSAYGELYETVRETEKKLSEINENDALAEQKKDILTYQINEIERADLTDGEEEELQSSRKRYLNSEQILSAAYACHAALFGDEDSPGASDLIDNALDALDTLSDYDGRAKDAYEKLNNLKYDLDDAADFIEELKDDSDLEEIDINAVESRLDLISRLKRKYGGSVKEILETLENLQQELYGIENADYAKEKLEKQLAEQKAELEKAADKLTKRRTACAKTLETAVMRELSDLDMAKTKFSVLLTPCDFTPHGKEKIEFLIAPNSGEDLKPLAKIASGGELSRIILALKAVLSKADPVSTMVFDEVDTGVSGRAAQKIAEKLRKLSESKQIFVITHLAQVAAFGNSHYRISKEEKNGKTFSKVELLDREGRIYELARIMSGTKITEAGLEAAKELLEMADKA